MNLDDDQRLGDLILARVADPDVPAPGWVTPGQWNEVGHLADLARHLRHDSAAAPPLDQDPVAAMLGLISDRRIQLDGQALKRARLTSQVSISQLADQLAARAWEVTQQDVFTWENQSSAAVPPALIEAIAAVLGTTPGRMTVDQRTPNDVTSRDAFDAATHTPRYQALVLRLGKVLGLTEDLARSRLRTTGAATVHRGDKPDQQQWLDTLEAYVSAIEARNERG